MLAESNTLHLYPGKNKRFFVDKSYNCYPTESISKYVRCRLHCQYCPFSVLNFYENEAQACLLMLRKFPRKYVSSSTKFLILIILEFCGSEIVPSSQPVEQKSAHSALILTITQLHSVLYYWRQFLFSHWVMSFKVVDMDDIVEGELRFLYHLDP